MTAANAMKTRRKALKSLLSEKVVSIGDYRSLRNGPRVRKLALVTTDQKMSEGLTENLKSDAELSVFDSRFSLEQALKQGDWDGVILDEKTLSEEALSLCEKLKRQVKFEDLFVVILSTNSSKEMVREGYEKGCDEWITQVGDMSQLAKLLIHHLHP